MKLYKVYSPGGRFGICTDPMTAEQLTKYFEDRPNVTDRRVETVEVADAKEILEDTQWPVWIVQSWDEHRL